MCFLVLAFLEVICLLSSTGLLRPIIGRSIRYAREKQWFLLALLGINTGRCPLQRSLLKSSRNVIKINHPHHRFLTANIIIALINYILKVSYGTKKNVLQPKQVLRTDWIFLKRHPHWAESYFPLTYSHYKKKICLHNTKNLVWLSPKVFTEEIT